MNNQQRIDQLEHQPMLSKGELVTLLSTYTDADQEYARRKARKITDQHFSNKIYIRGLIECTNYCKNDCLYCGIRRSNQQIIRYRLNQEQILCCCRQGYDLGFRTFVLQGGEDNGYTDEFIVEIIRAMREQYPDCAITLSLGEKSYDSYLKYYQAGANRYLLRHETANAIHYQKLHPTELTLANRMRCLFDLKIIGFQTGCGMMIGSPDQTIEDLADDLLFIHQLDPQMVGVGPFLPHHDTPFRDEPAGSLSLTLMMLSLVRIMLKGVLLPATTALASLHPEGRILGIEAGANVVMPNLSPVEVRNQYMLYDNKLSSGNESAQAVRELKELMVTIGYQIVQDRGDWCPNDSKM